MMHLETSWSRLMFSISEVTVFYCLLYKTSDTAASKQL